MARGKGFLANTTTPSKDFLKMVVYYMVRGSKISTSITPFTLLPWDDGPEGAPTMQVVGLLRFAVMRSKSVLVRVLFEAKFEKEV